MNESMREKKRAINQSINQFNNFNQFDSIQSKQSN